MKVNNVNNYTNFGRAIPVCVEKNTEFNVSVNNIDNSIFELNNVLNSKKSKLYTKKQSESIRGFFKDVLGDYNGKNGIKLKKVNDDTILLSGQDFNNIKQTESCKNKSIHKKKAVEDEIKKRIEDGECGKPESIILLEASEPSYCAAAPNNKKYSNGNIKFDSILYSSIGTAYARLHDGSRYEFDETKNGIIIKDYICNQKELRI